MTGRRTSGRYRPQGLDPADDGLHVRQEPDGCIPLGPRRQAGHDRHERGLGLTLGRLQRLPFADADAHLFRIRSAEAGQLRVVAPPSCLHFRKPDGSQVALRKGWIVLNSNFQLNFKFDSEAIFYDWNVNDTFCFLCRHFHYNRKSSGNWKLIPDKRLLKGK